MVLSRITVVNRQVGHCESVHGSRQPLHDPADSIPMKLLTKLVDELWSGRSIGLGKGEVELAANALEVVMR